MTNVDIICSVISLLGVDGSLNRHEMKYFDEVCERLGVTPDEKAAVIAKVKQGKGSIHLPQDDADKKRLIYFLAQASVVDGKITDQERKVLENVAKRLEIPWDYVTKFLEARLKEIKTERYTTANRPEIECPKCGYKQPASHQCNRCGIIFEKYKQAHGQSDEEKLRDILASSNVISKEE